MVLFHTCFSTVHSVTSFLKQKVFKISTDSFASFLSLDAACRVPVLPLSLSATPPLLRHRCVVSTWLINSVASFLHVPRSFTGTFVRLHSVVPVYPYFGERCLKADSFFLQYFLMLAYVLRFCRIIMVEVDLFASYLNLFLPDFLRDHFFHLKL